MIASWVRVQKPVTLDALRSVNHLLENVNSKIDGSRQDIDDCGSRSRK